MASPFQITDGERNLILDKGRGLPNIPWEHHKIHEGDSYRADQVASVGSGNTTTLTITTGNKVLHCVFIGASEASANFTVYEDTDITANSGNSLTPRNANRNVVDSSSVSVVQDATVNTTNRVELVKDFMRSSGGGTYPTASPGSSTSRTEWNLKKNKSYTIEIENTSNSATLIHVGADWYEV